MPLKKSPTPEAFTENLKAEIGAGKDQKQALAIAYSVQKQAVRDAQQKRHTASQKKR